MRTTVIVKVVGMDCDLRCSYCYYESQARQNDGIVMGLSLKQPSTRPRCFDTTKTRHLGKFLCLIYSILSQNNPTNSTL